MEYQGHPSYPFFRNFELYFKNSPVSKSRSISMVQLHLTGSHSLIFEIAVTVGILIILIILLYIFRFLKQLNSKTQFKSTRRKGADGNISKEVNAMLRQYGKGLTQKEIANNLGLPHHVVAQKLLEMEDKGLIVRKWDKEEFTYTIHKR